ncbi:MAG: hypothetical protein KDE66_03500 [Nitrosomonas sp.]|nr:hypothetical protein [Nitrosomonas sp.]
MTDVNCLIESRSQALLWLECYIAQGFCLAGHTWSAMKSNRCSPAEFHGQNDGMLEFAGLLQNLMASILADVVMQDLVPLDVFDHQS